jgi:subtilisin family serine protease
VAEPKGEQVESPDAVRSDGSVGIIVKLHDESVAVHAARFGLEAKGKGEVVQRHLAKLRDRQSRFEQKLRSVAPRARVGHRLQVVLNALSMTVSRADVDQIRRLPEVAAVYYDNRQETLSSHTPAYIGAPQLWAQLGGQASAGEGMVIGVIDGGVWPEHPSFSDPDAAGDPYPAPAGWNGAPCEFGSASPGDAAFTCNNKLIGARRIMATYDATVTPGANEFLSARDEVGHGTHVATVAAGNAGVNAAVAGNPLGVLSGVAPRARLAVYKVCGRQGCFDSDAAAAVQQAVLDGVDVISYAVTGGNDPYSDAVSLAFLDAYQAGVFVATSSGNSGLGTASHLEPWTMTVGATSVDKTYRSTLTVRSATPGILTLNGMSITGGLAAATPVVNAADFGDPNCVETGPPGTYAGKAVICARGGNSRTEKGANVKAMGGVAVILINPSTAGLNADNHFLPTIHLEKGESDALLAYLAARSGETVTFTPGARVAAQGDVLLSTSSRAGASQTLGISKPDVSAPGVQVLGGHVPVALPSSGAPNELFAVHSGTSMSAAHIAGAAALLKSLNPEWTPGQIKSALMLTANTSVRREDGATLAGPFETGSGRVRLALAARPGLSISPAPGEFETHRARLWDANYPSLYLPRIPGIISVQRTIENLENVEKTWSVAAYAPADVRLTIPASITIPARGAFTMSITVEASMVPIDHVRHAYVVFFESGGTRSLVFPISLIKRPGGIPITKSCAPATLALNGTTSCSVTVENTSFQPATITMYDMLPPALQLVPGSVTNATVFGNAVAFQGTLAGAIPGSVDVRRGAAWEGFVSLATYYPAIACAGSCDDRFFVATIPSGILFNGVSYTSISMSSNGFVQLGGGTSSWPQNRNMPDPTPPNNILAPFWTDLHPLGTDGLGGGKMYLGYLTYPSGRTWLVAEWNDVLVKGSSARQTFQVWLQVGGRVEDIVYSYVKVQGTGAFGQLTIGAESADGGAGEPYYYNGVGTMPGASSNLMVSSPQASPGGTHTITFQATARASGPYTNCAWVLNDLSPDIAVSCVSGAVR